MSEFEYQAGFGNALSSEALPGALPRHINSPRKVPYGLFSEQINGTGFTVERALNRRTWMYRLRPLLHERGWERIDAGRFASDFGEGLSSPEVMRWTPWEIASQPKDFLAGIQTFAGGGGPALKRGMAIHIFEANQDMERIFANPDGDLLLIPNLGSLRLQTELGWLELKVGELAILPRGIRFRVTLPEGASRGWIAELYEGHFVLPERGPVGANGLADERHFLAPTASFEDVAEDTVVVVKQAGQLWQTVAPHSPFDVVAWHGNYAPFKYDMRRFNPLGAVTFDHPDPSINTVLTAPADTHGRNAFDLAAFVPRWDASQGTFRPPFLHRNAAIEFNGVVQNGNSQKWKPGTFSYTPYLSPHSVSTAAYHSQLALDDEAADAPARTPDDSLWIQFESTYQLYVMPWWLDHPHRDPSFLDNFSDYPLGELAGGG